MPTTDYTIERTESYDWLFRKRYNWRIRAANGQIILSSNQGHSRRIDRENVIGHFFEKVVHGQSMGFAEYKPDHEPLTVPSDE
jgi:hypothetical protein